MGSGDLEIHISEEVFYSLNIEHCEPSILVGDKPAGYAGNGRLDRNSRVHQGESTAADRAFRS